MGIDIAFGRQLIAAGSYVDCKGRGVMLGRQGFGIKPRHYHLLRAALRKAGRAEDVSILTQKDGFSEKFLEGLGFPEMKSIDASPYEGSDLVHDLNDSVPLDWQGQFDVILDGGTSEHDFDTPQALDNIFHMLSEGGVFISANGLTIWSGHGFYQFCSELVWRYWGDGRKCDVLECMALSTDPNKTIRPAPDTGKKGSRLRGRGKEVRWSLYYVIRRPGGANPAQNITKVAQGDYDALWQTHLEHQT